MMAVQALPSHWNLAELLDGICDIPGIPAVEIQGLSLDSRKVNKGDLFFACAGSQVHGKEFIQEAVERGASAVLVEPDGNEIQYQDTVPVFPVTGLKNRVGIIAERFYGSPTKDQFVVGVTGTNGKTSISHFVAQAISAADPCGIIGTLGNGVFGELAQATHTTPDAISLHAILDELHHSGVKTVVMEVSSHALEQGRSSGVDFDVAVFSNLSHEHLDYHGDMQAYGRAKRRLFEQECLGYAVINCDDEFGRQLLNSLPETVRGIGYSTGDSPLASIVATDLELAQHGLSMQVQSPWGNGRLSAPLLGEFNASNLLAALGVLLVNGIAFEDALNRLSRVKPVPGRMESFGGDDARPLVVVDYAHTPDALEQVLTALRPHASGEIWCVFGCGGERDTTKRPVMATIAERLADQVVVTDDNPRGENPGDIIAEIMRGFTDSQAVRVINDRAQAIKQAIESAAAEDVVLIAGKGHEDYQLVGDKRIPFSDVEEVTRSLQFQEGVN